MKRDELLATLTGHLGRIAAALEAQLRVPGELSRLDPAGSAFVWSDGAGIRRVRTVATIDPAVLTGIDRQRQAFYENIRRFLAGHPCHDVLLWGERGTGKSSLVRSLPAAFPEGAVALLEIPESGIPELPRILALLEADPRRWVLYLDDITFDGPGEHYREFKVLLEGGLEARPENTLAVATSNRRHLVPEAFPSAEEIHPEEAVAASISLADRFGLSLGFYPFDEPTYLEAVRRHLAALGVDPPPAAWEVESLRWAMARGIRSGRAALQAARQIAGNALRGCAPR